MNKLEVFNFQGKEVRSLMIGDEPYFVGKDVAEALGYKNTKDALISHVDAEDKKIIQRSEIATLENHIPNKALPIEFVWSDIPNRGLTIINESGLYSLILSSKLPTAKEFKRWVTSEVLPSIRKTGGYQSELKKDPMSLLKLTYDALEQTNDRVTKVETDVKDIKENQAITPGEYNYINQKVRNRIRLVKEMRDLELTKEQNSHLFKSLGRDLTAFTKVHTRSQIRAKDFEKAVQFIDDWEPSYTDLQIISQLAMDI